MIQSRFISSAADLNSTIAAHLSNDSLAAAAAAFAANPHHRNTTSWNLLISGHARYGEIRLAQNLFDEMPHRDIISWNAIIAAHRRAGEPLTSFQIFIKMLRHGLRPTGSTLATIASAPLPAAIPQLHGTIVRSGHGSNTVVGTALVGGYAASGDAVALRRAFQEIPLKNSVSWTALIAGYMRVGLPLDACRAFDEMPEKTTVARTALISGYCANGNVVEARRCFDAAENRSAIAWTAMVSGYVRHGSFADALRLFVAAGKPNRYLYSAALAASGGLGSVRSGESIHGRILKTGLPLDPALATALIDMYGRCGDADAAVATFASAAAGGSPKATATWNAMIGALGRNGRAMSAVAELRQMAAGGVAPDQTTFVQVLSACAHGGLIEEGERIFGSMGREFGVAASREHYGCMVDLYGRAGKKEAAEAAAEAMPAGPDSAAAVAAAAAGGAVSAGEEMGAGGHALMARVYGDRGETERVREMKERMEAAAGSRGKQRGLSWVETLLLRKEN